MAFSYAVGGSTVFGDRRIKWGTFANGAADTGGAIVTGLQSINGYGVHFISHVGTNVPKTTVSGGTITIITETGADGMWWAFGK